MTRTLRTAAATTALLALAVGCGEEAAPTASEPSGADASTTATASPSSVPTTPDAPDTTEPTRPPVVRPPCDEVWSGVTLPRDYRGCTDGDRVVRPGAFTCSMGGQLVVYGDHYALTGRKINRTQGPPAQDPDYASALRACTA